jgi:hypothetical protein
MPRLIRPLPVLAVVFPLASPHAAAEGPVVTQARPLQAQAALAVSQVLALEAVVLRSTVARQALVELVALAWLPC